jgi:glyoxylase-like metal-dependent hydrolase (beta-lactamase superfamily II)
MRVHHLNCGTLCPRPEKLLRGKGRLLGPTRMVCHCMVVELSDGLALVDTGLGTEDVAAPVKRLGAGFVALVAPRCRQEETALARLAALGFGARDVRHILPTHLDLDHAGGIGDFPDATVHVLAQEHAAAVAPRNWLERQRYRPRQWSSARWQMHPSQGETWFGFDGVRPLPGTQDEVLIIPLYGHTRGHAGIAVRGDTGWILHAGDAYFTHEEVHGTPPSCPRGLSVFQQVIQVDGEQRLRNQARLTELVRTHGGEVTVVCAHDAGELEALSGTSS